MSAKEVKFSDDARSHMVKGVNTFQGYITCEPVAASLGMRNKYKPFDALYKVG